MTFQCLAQSTNPNSTLQYSWAYPTGQAADIVVDGDTLTVSNVGEESSGVYVCTVVDILTGAMAVANGTLDIGKCTLGRGGEGRAGEEGRGGEGKGGEGRGGEGSGAEVFVRTN